MLDEQVDVAAVGLRRWVVLIIDGMDGAVPEGIAASSSVERKSVGELVGRGGVEDWVAV